MVNCWDSAGVMNSPIRVLVIDDDAETRAMTRAMLEKEGWSVSEANNGLEALESMQRERPTLIFLDLIMPEMDGVEATRRIMAATPCPILIVTGSVGIEKRRGDRVERLATLALPVAERSQRIVHAMMVVEADACATLRAKSGLSGVSAREFDTYVAPLFARQPALESMFWMPRVSRARRAATRPSRLRSGSN